MKMVRSDLAASGVVFSLDTDSGFRDVVFIEGAYGLGENVVQGAVDPDEFYVHKPTYEAGQRAVLRRGLGDKAIKMMFVEGEVKQTVRNIPTPKADRERYCISDDDVLQIADYAIKIERHYGRPMDMEWAKDGVDGKIYAVQARPETVASQRKVTMHALRARPRAHDRDALRQERQEIVDAVQPRPRPVGCIRGPSQMRPQPGSDRPHTRPMWRIGPRVRRVRPPRGLGTSPYPLSARAPDAGHVTPADDPWHSVSEEWRIVMSLAT